VHNHPSGDCNPSDEDERITEVMRETGYLLKINLLDHLIIGKGDYQSLVS
jgi:DNA repair protein RadC